LVKKAFLEKACQSHGMFHFPIFGVVGWEHEHRNSEVGLGGKVKAPSSNIQAPEKLQIPNTKTEIAAGSAAVDEMDEMGSRSGRSAGAPTGAGEGARAPKPEGRRSYRVLPGEIAYSRVEAL